MFRNIKPVIIFLLFTLGVSINAGAEEILAPLEKSSLTGLTWQDCVREAKENHPDLVSAGEQIYQAESDKAITKSTYLPQISSDAAGKTSKTAGKDSAETYSYGVSAKQLLFDGFKTAQDIAAAFANIKSAQYNYNVTSSDVRLRLRTAFVELLKAQELEDITEDIAKRRKQNLDLVQLRYEAGREHKGALLTSGADLARAEFEVTQAQRDISLSQRKLTKELGRSQKAQIKAEGNFEIAYVDEVPDFESLTDNTPFLRQLIAKKDTAGFGLKSAEAEFFPEVYANLSAGRTASKWPPDKDEWSGGLSLSFPIFEGGSRIAKVDKARAKLNQTEADRRSGHDSIILTLEQTWKELQDAIDKVKVQQKFLEAAQERAKITQAQYSIGLVSFDDWSIIEDNLVQAKKAFLDAKANALIAQANWIQARGGTLDDATK